jgi:hypothetical protein
MSKLLPVLVLVVVALAPASPPPQTPEEVVERQVEAYNARDLEAFLAFYSPGSVITELATGRVVAAGAEHLRERYRPNFANPRIRAEIVKRIALGRFVIDEERITGLPDGQILRAVVIYEVGRDRIRRAWFIGE